MLCRNNVKELVGNTSDSDSCVVINCSQIKSAVVCSTCYNALLLVSFVLFAFTV